ncbi:YoaK family protein [Atopobacter phocae]|uniref:YoaK family protein n=1 Tax=Atopobacter phocae TaxID=136492 RepID=UPI000472B379|nr:YoaK family protein [Atopobacter phocae]
MYRKLIEPKLSESLIIGGLLALIGGGLDAYTYTTRGGVFAFAQTGNILLLSIHIFDLDYHEALRYVWPIFAFMIGTYVGLEIKHFFAKLRMRRSIRINEQQILLLINAGLLLVIGWIPLGEMDFIANLIVSFVCAMQLQTITRLKGRNFMSTMQTGNLRLGVINFFNFRVTHSLYDLSSAGLYFLIIAIFISGASFCTYLVHMIGKWAILFPFALTCLIALILFLEETPKKNTK